MLSYKLIPPLASLIIDYILPSLADYRSAHMKRFFRCRSELSYKNNKGLTGIDIGECYTDAMCCMCFNMCLNVSGHPMIVGIGTWVYKTCSQDPEMYERDGIYICRKCYYENELHKYNYKTLKIGRTEPDKFHVYCFKKLEDMDYI